MIVPCECGAKLKIDDAKISDKGVKVRCPRCGNVLSVQKPGAAPAGFSGFALPLPSALPKLQGPLVLVAHDSDVVRGMIRDVLLEEGFSVESAADGVEALNKATEIKPQAMVLDVGLSGIYGFELCERLKGNQETKGIKIILLASVYDMTRYKRKPVNLYGADDYIEKHHIPDTLALKIRKLISPEEFTPPVSEVKSTPLHDLPEMSRPPEREFEPSLLGSESQSNVEGEAAGPTAAQSVARKSSLTSGLESSAIIPESFSLDASIFQKEECDIPRVDEADPKAVEKARRFARIIVSDIALYNQQTVIEGLKNGTFYELLKNDVDEGRELFEKRVPPVIRAQKDYYQEAFDNFIHAQNNNVR